MGDELNTAGGDRQADVVSEFDQTDGLADETFGDDDGGLAPGERDDVFEDAMISLDRSPMAHGIRSYSEEGRP